MNIYLTEYGHMCGRYSAIVVAKDEEEAVSYFKTYFKDEIGSSVRGRKLGKAEKKEKPGIVMAQEVY